MACQVDRHHANNSKCPLNTRPHDVQECCQFKWRNLWSPVRFYPNKLHLKKAQFHKLHCFLQCSAKCGMGTRSRQRVCMRLFYRNPNEKTRKKGQPVGERYCQHMKQPPFTAKTKPCQKQMCAAPKWVVSPWTKVSVRNQDFIHRITMLNFHF